MEENIPRAVSVFNKSSADIYVRGKEDFVSCILKKL